jgi:hypothetical protein
MCPPRVVPPRGQLLAAGFPRKKAHSTLEGKRSSHLCGASLCTLISMHMCRMSINYVAED